MKNLSSILAWSIAGPLSLIGICTIFIFYDNNYRATELGRMYDALERIDTVEAFGLAASINTGGWAELWLTNGGFLHFSFAGPRDLVKESHQRIYQIGNYAFRCENEGKLAEFVRFNQLRDALELPGDFSLSRVMDDYDSLLESVSRLPDESSHAPNALGTNCWKKTVPTHEFYMYPPISIKDDNGYVYWKEAGPHCPNFIRIELCDRRP